MEKKQFITAGILILASVGLVLAIESTPKAETASQNEDAAAKILELEHKIDVQEKLIVRLKKQLRNKTKENRNLKILCKQYNIPESAYKELMRGPRRQRPDGAVKVPCDIVATRTNILGITAKAVGWPLTFGSAEVGEIGWLVRAPVVQVVDDTNAIINIRVGSYQWLNYMIYKGHEYPSFRRGFAGSERAVWLKGISMKDVVDESWIEINHLMKITGTTTYKTAAGSQKTLFVVEKIPYYFPKGYGPEGKLRRK